MSLLKINHADYITVFKNHSFEEILNYENNDDVVYNKPSILNLNSALLLKNQGYEIDIPQGLTEFLQPISLNKNQAKQLVTQMYNDKIFIENLKEEIIWAESNPRSEENNWELDEVDHSEIYIDNLVASFRPIWMGHLSIDFRIKLAVFLRKEMGI